MTITVLLVSFAKTKSIVAQYKLDNTKVDDAFLRCQQSLNDWIVQTSVIGGSGFGGSSRGHEELEVIHVQLFFNIYLVVSDKSPHNLCHSYATGYVHLFIALLPV